jgi:hypothetical protein
MTQGERMSETEIDFMAAARANIRRAGQPCSIGSMLVQMRSERPGIAKGFEASMEAGIPASAIARTLADCGYPDVPDQRINHHRYGRCRNCPAKTA